LRKGEGVADRRIDLGGDLILADIPLLPADARAQDQPVLFRQILHDLGVGRVQAGARPQAGIEHQGWDVGFLEAAGRELCERDELTPKSPFG